MFFTTEFIEDTEKSSTTVIPGNDPESSCYKCFYRRVRPPSPRLWRASSLSAEALAKEDAAIKVHISVVRKPPKSFVKPAPVNRTFLLTFNPVGRQFIIAPNI